MIDYRTARAKALALAQELPGNVTVDSNHVKTISVDGRRFIACANWKDVLHVLRGMGRVAAAGKSYLDEYEWLMSLHDGKQ